MQTIYVLTAVEQTCGSAYISGHFSMACFPQRNLND